MKDLEAITETIESRWPGIYDIDVFQHGGKDHVTISMKEAPQMDFEAMRHIMESFGFEQGWSEVPTECSYDRDSDETPRTPWYRYKVQCPACYKAKEVHTMEFWGEKPPFTREPTLWEDSVNNGKPFPIYPHCCDAKAGIILEYLGVKE